MIPDFEEWYTDVPSGLYMVIEVEGQPGGVPLAARALLSDPEYYDWFVGGEEELVRQIIINTDLYWGPDDNRSKDFVISVPWVMQPRLSDVLWAAGLKENPWTKRYRPNNGIVVVESSLPDLMSVTKGTHGATAVAAKTEGWSAVELPRYWSIALMYYLTHAHSSHRFFCWWDCKDRTQSAP